MATCALQKHDLYVLNCRECGSMMQNWKPRRKRCAICGKPVQIKFFKNVNLQSH